MRTRKKMSYRKHQAIIAYSFISLWIVGFLVFTLYPFIQTAYLSFQSVRVSGTGIKSTFLGFQNFKDAFLVDLKFSDTLLSYLGEIVIYLPIVIVFSLLIALLLNLKVKGTGFFRTIFFLPVIISSGPVIQMLVSKGTVAIPAIDDFIASGMISNAIPPPFGGMITQALSSFIIILWYSGVPILIFLAGLTKIDRSVYEAASIDGAGKWESFWKITLPALNPMIVLNVVYTIITISTNSMNGVIQHIQKTSFDANYGLGYAAALSWIYFVVLFIMLGISVWIVSQKKPKERGGRYDQLQKKAKTNKKIQLQRLFKKPIKDTHT